MIAVLASTSGFGLLRVRVISALSATVLCIIMSISFTPYVGTIATVVMLTTLMFIPFTPQAGASVDAADLRRVVRLHV